MARSLAMFPVRVGALFVATALLASHARSELRLARIFSDGAVLLSDARVAVFGFATPGESVRVEGSFALAPEVSHADPEGRFCAWLQTRGAGGPHTIEVRSRREVVRVSDVWLGEVWLASGQSNMEMPVGPIPGLWEGVVDCERELARAEDAGIRLFTVQNATALAPGTDVVGRWARADRSSVASFSATAWFFARALRQELGVPIGIVASDYGATSVEAWTSGITLARDPDHAEGIARLARRAQDPRRGAEERERTRAAWMQAIEEADRGLARGHGARACDDADWTSVSLPGEIGGEYAGFDGVVWLRRSFEVPSGLAGADARLSLGRIDDSDAVFVDGELVGATLERASIRAGREYTVPARLLAEGTHAIAIRVVDRAGPLVILADRAEMRLSAGALAIPLGGEWRAKKGAGVALLPAVPDEAEFEDRGPSTVYNAMIAPLLSFRFRGVIWYQGESNRLQAEGATRAFPALVEDWRARFQADELPFYAVQIAPFLYDRDLGQAAELREAQRRILRLPHTGLVATNDLGDPADIHPRAKRAVGERLARWALARTYGRDLECSGPILREQDSGPRPEAGTFELAFDHAGGLRFRGGGRGVFEIATSAGPWVPAEARIDGDRVVLSSERCPTPSAARLDPWDGRRGHLVNSADLPALAFQVGDRPWITRQPRSRARATRSGDVLTLAPPIETAVEGLPLGNGLVGAFVWMDGGTLKLLLGRSDFWDARRVPLTGAPDWNAADLLARVRAGDEQGIHARYDEPYERIPHPTRLPLAELSFPLGERAPRAFGLDLVRAEAGIPLSSGHVRAFVSAARPLVCVRIDGAAPAALDPARATLLVHGGSGSASASEIHGLARSADGSTLGVAIAVGERGGGTELVIATVAQAESSDPLAAAREKARAGLEVGYAPLLGEHLATFGALRGGVRITIGERLVQDQVDLAQHLLLSAARRGAPPAALQGPWTGAFALPPWHGDYHLDLNLQAVYGACSTAGHFDAMRGLFEYLSELAPRRREFAREFHGVEGALLPGVMALDGSPLGGWAQYALSPTHGAWLGHLAARHWRVARDPEFLAVHAAPFVRETATALRALAPPGPDGRRRLAWSSSPEWGDASLRAWLPPNSNYDLALLAAAFTDAASLARAQGQEDEARAWEAVLGELPGFARDENGALAIAPGIPYDASHRHLSHALAVFPLGLISIEGGADERALVDATLDGILARGTRAWAGYTFPWCAAIAARAGRAETARRLLLEYARAFTFGNGLHANGDLSGGTASDLTGGVFTLEGNALALEAVEEMLLQSWGGVVRVFPAASVLWPDAAFDGLRAEGGFEVSAARGAGLVRSVRVRAERGGALRLRDPFGGAQVDWSGTREAPRREGADWVVDLGIGEALVGVRAGT